MHSPFQQEVSQQQPRRSGWQRVQDWINKYRPPTTGVAVTPELILLVVVAYGVLFFSMGDIWLPGHGPFCTVVIWICSLVAADIFNWLRMPRVVGMLGAGMLLTNVPGDVVAAFPARWGTQMRAAALATIFLRCGLELEFKTMRLYKWPALRLAFIPGMCEALFDAGVAYAVFNMPIMLALSLGFILKAVGPGLVVPAMFQLQKSGLGAKKGIPSTVVIAASFDDIIAITGFSIFISLAITGQDNVAWNIAAGPAQVFFGFFAGLIAGAILGCTKIFNNKYKRLIGIYGACLLIMFFLEHFNMLSGGALGALSVGLVTCYFWESGRPHSLSLGPSDSYSFDIERVLSTVWSWIMEPMLFGTIGTSINFSTLSTSTIPLSVLVVCTGLAVRTIITSFTMVGLGYNWKERLFYAIAWTPKATVQASLSAYPLYLIQLLIPPSNPQYAEWVKWGNEILTTGIFAIIICGTVGTLFVFWTAPLLLEQGDATVEGGSRDGSRPMGHAPSLADGVGRVPSSLPGAARLRPAASGQYATGRGRAKSLQLLRTGTHGTILVDQYFDAIDALIDSMQTTVVTEGQDNDRIDAICTRIRDLQARLDSELGARDMTVRQMLHAAALQSSLHTLAPGGERHTILMDTLHELSQQDKPVSSKEVATAIANIVIDSNDVENQHPSGSSPRRLQQQQQQQQQQAVGTGNGVNGHAPVLGTGSP